MATIKLSKRLLRIAQFVPDRTKVADIGSDHALLPSYLVLNNIVQFAVAGEVNEGPYLSAEKQISDLNLSNNVSVRKGDGLSVIKTGEVDVITIAGMGGALIVHILNDGKEKLANIKRMILQPNVGSELVREWLDKNYWNIIDEDIIEEEKKIYEIIVTEKRTGTDDPAYNSSKWTKEELYRLGPILIKQESVILVKKWMYELKKIEQILRQINNANNESEKNNKRQELLKEKEWLLGVISCLQRAKT